MKTLGAKSIVAIVVPETSTAYQTCAEYRESSQPRERWK
jgi:hypothetical protein